MCDFTQPEQATRRASVSKEHTQNHTLQISVCQCRTHGNHTHMQTQDCDALKTQSVFPAGVLLKCENIHFFRIFHAA